MTKYCPGCESTLSLDDFGINNSRYDNKQHACKECMKEKRRAAYRANKQPYFDRAKALEAKLIGILREKKNVPCERCGIEYPGEPWLMEFDHRDQKDKLFSVGQMVKKGNIAKLLAEINKCDILCVVCHRRRTAIQLGWIK